MCLRPQRGAFSEVLYVPHPRIAVLLQCESFGADFGTAAVFALCVTPKSPSGERVVPPVVALHGRFFCAQTLAGTVFQKETWPPTA